MSERFIGKATKGRRIRNGQIRRDFKRLLEIIADPREPDYAEVEAIAERHALYFDDDGAIKEYPEKGRLEYDVERR